MILQNDINVQGGLANKTDMINDTCTIIPYPAVQEKHIWQGYVTSKLNIKLFCFFTTRGKV